jgi:hypothetical protein
MAGRVNGVRATARLMRTMPMVVVLAAAVALMHSWAGAGKLAAAATSATHMACCPSVVNGTEQVRPSGAGENPSPGHGLAHLCLAVLSALVVGLVGGCLVRRRNGGSGSSVGMGRTGEHTLPRPPSRPSGRALLDSVCVLRI